MPSPRAESPYVGISPGPRLTPVSWNNRVLLLAAKGSADHNHRHHKSAFDAITKQSRGVPFPDYKGIGENHLAANPPQNAGADIDQCGEAIHQAREQIAG